MRAGSAAYSVAFTGAAVYFFVALCAWVTLGFKQGPDGKQVAFRLSTKGFLLLPMFGCLVFILVSAAVLAATSP